MYSGHHILVDRGYENIFNQVPNLNGVVVLHFFEL
jgi:hypothetical protein